MTAYEAALTYIARGWSVIPLRPRDKRPLGSWKEYQTRYPTPGELKDWFDGTENNIGVVAGALSNLTIVDCDSVDAILFFETTTAEQGEDPATYQVQTAHGMHYYYHFVPGSSNFQAKKEWPGIDLRSEGGYVVAPPSIHPSGTAYTLGSGAFSFGGDLATAPTWLFSTKPAQKTEVTQGDDRDSLFAPASPGQRNMALTRLAGLLLRDSPFSVALPVCEMWNKQNAEPLPTEELRRTVQSVAAKHAANQAEGVPGVDRTMVKSFLDYFDEILALRKTGIPQGQSTGFTTMDEYYRVPFKQWTLVTGAPGSGKSTWLSHLMINLMENEGWKFLIFSAENVPAQHYGARLVATYLKKPFHHGYHERLTEQEVEYGLQFLHAHCRIIDTGEQTLSVAGILELARIYQEEWGFQGLIMDPWNEIDHDAGQGKLETNVIGEELGRIRRFTRQRDQHTWVVAHPRQMHKMKDSEQYAVPTPSDVSGSANFRNKADFCVTVNRPMVIEDGEVCISRHTDIYIQKVRFSENGMIGKITLGFDAKTGRYYDLEGAR